MAGALRGRAAMAGSVACLTSAKIAINVAGCTGDDNYAMVRACFLCCS